MCLEEVKTEEQSTLNKYPLNWVGSLWKSCSEAGHWGCKTWEQQKE